MKSRNANNSEHAQPKKEDRALGDRHWRGVNPIRVARSSACNEHPREMPHWGCGFLEKIEASHLSRARVVLVIAITDLEFLKFRDAPCDGTGIYKKRERPLPRMMRPLRSARGGTSNGIDGS